MVNADGDSIQQMSNILLNSPDQAQKASLSSSKAGVEANANPIAGNGSSFSSELEKAANVEAVNGDYQQPKAEASKQHESDKQDLASAETLTDAAEQQIADTEPAAKDDVSHVLAQINLASQFSAEAEANSQLAANGESLPLTSDALSSEAATDELVDVSVDDLPDEVLLTLSMQSGLTEQELSQLSESELKALLQQNQLIDSNGQPTPELLAAISASTLSGANSGNQSIGGNGVTANELLATADKNGADAKQDASNLTGQSKLPNENKDLFGKELNLAGANQASESLKQTKNSELSANAAVANQTVVTAAAEQLKNAELTVRMSATEAGLEANLDSELSAVSDSKSLSALQQQLQQTTANRQELPQLHASLKQAGEVTPSMQQMIQRFAPVMNQQLITMVSNGLQQAEIRLDPPELGQMMVRIQVQGDNTQVQFQVAQHQTRDLVEQAMPRLREMLAEQGMQLTDGQVSHGNGGQGQGEGTSEHGNGSGTHDVDEISAEDMLARSNLSTSSVSGIDYYA